MTTNEQFSRAYADPNNKGIIRGVLSKFINQIEPDELDQCGAIALWRCLEKHQDNHPSGQKFTTSLYRFVIWECIKKLRTLKRWRKKSHPSLLSETPSQPPSTFTKHVQDCLSCLSEEHRWSLELYYMDRENISTLQTELKLDKKKTTTTLKEAETAFRTVAKRGMYFGKGEQNGSLEVHIPVAYRLAGDSDIPKLTGPSRAALAS